jgi:Ca2+-binding EF-hand superfamily protein
MVDAAQKAKILEEFKKLDADNTGFLDRNEVKRSLKELYDAIDLKLTDADVDNLIKRVDKNNDGKISIDEFINLI